MKKPIFLAIITLVAGITAFSFWGGKLREIAAPTVPDLFAGGKPHKTMRPFTSAKALKDFLQKHTENERRGAQIAAGEPASNAAASPSPAKSVNADATASKDDSKSGESVTNNQVAGVDEGGIVKVHGDHLVILRRGRLFTVRVGDNSLKAVDAINAYAPGINPSNDWYDEMLIAEDTVIVIGYSYGRGGTEINLFDIDGGGDLSYRSTYHLRSNDYYSSRNYASRLIGNKLVFYTPEYLGYGDAMERFPAVRRWHKGATEKEFRQIVAPTSVYRSERESSNLQALHTVTVCDLADRGFSCKGTGVLGAPGRVFYVSASSVYIWTTDWNYGTSKSTSMVYRMPLDGSAPSGLGVAGSPVDQFSFLESDDNNLNVLVRSEGRGDQMWGAEVAAGDVALFRVPIDSFSDGSESAPASRYRQMPKVDGYTFQNRFVGDYLLYGTGNGWGQPEKQNAANLFAVNWTSAEINRLHLNHTVDRIEQMGKDAVVVGTNGSDLYFSPVRLGDSPRVMDSYARKNASQGELRSHGFFYKPDGKDSGLLGLPIAREGRAGYRHLVEGSAAILFLRNKGLDLDEMGELGADNVTTDDNCRASCVDWYGNARPLFLRNRVFALLGYELVEGTVYPTYIREERRINYSPRSLTRVSGE